MEIKIDLNTIEASFDSSREEIIIEKDTLLDYIREEIASQCSVVDLLKVNFELTFESKLYDVENFNINHRNGDLIIEL